MPATTPLTDAINALTQYANETTGASDTTLSDAVGTLVAGYGGGGGTSIGKNTDQNLAQMFYALENGTAVTGTTTFARALPNTEELIFSSGLNKLRGFFYMCDDVVGLNPGVNTSIMGYCLFDSNGDLLNPGGVCKFNGATNGNANPVTNSRKFVNMGSVRFDGGDFYVTAEYNRNANYTPFAVGHTYRWVAW